MTDRLEEIDYVDHEITEDDVRWLIAEVRRLRGVLEDADSVLTMEGCPATMEPRASIGRALEQSYVTAGTGEEAEQDRLRLRAESDWAHMRPSTSPTSRQSSPHASCARSADS